MTMTKNTEINKFGLSEAPKESSAVRRVDSNDFKETSEVHELIETTLPSESSERMGEDVKGDGSAQGTMDDDISVATVGSDQLKSLPSQKVMAKQVSQKIEKEIKSLKKEARRMQWFFWDFDPNRYQKIIREIRNLCHVLASLAHATYENVRSLWMKYVQKHS